MARRPLINITPKDSISNRVREEMEVPNLFIKLRVMPPVPYRDDSKTLLEMTLNKISKLIKSKHGKSNT